MSTLIQRSQVTELVSQAIVAGARQDRACRAIGLSERTLQRWQREPSCGDQRPTRVQTPKNRLSEQERQQVLAVANSQEFGHLAPSQIVPRLADGGQYVASESTFYRVLKAAHQLGHRSPERPKQKRSKPRALCATAPNQLFSWDITYPEVRVQIVQHQVDTTCLGVGASLHFADERDEVGFRSALGNRDNALPRFGLHRHKQVVPWRVYS
ncbi:MAG: helix-turn-helix domain-containing protein [Rhodoferax sp.]|nr:helix-turn-helix domain-containing protein [Rhodoferax sp.]NDP40619.1 helix-turn-helix domain-containing protein [Rhodoferax sp.]